MSEVKGLIAEQEETSMARQRIGHPRAWGAGQPLEREYSLEYEPIAVIRTGGRAKFVVQIKKIKKKRGHARDTYFSIKLTFNGHLFGCWCFPNIVIYIPPSYPLLSVLFFT